MHGWFYGLEIKRKWSSWKTCHRYARFTIKKTADPEAERGKKKKKKDLHEACLICIIGERHARCAVRS